MAVDLDSEIWKSKQLPRTYAQRGSFLRTEGIARPW
jgi:hypothetical protein